MTTSSPLRSSYDVVVVGARCAGAATALQMANRGLRVLAVERSAYGSDTLSTLALMRPAVLQLQRWGLLERLRATGAPPIRSTSFHYGDEPALQIQIKPRGGVDALYAPRRTDLDALLVDAATAAGVEIIHRARVVDLITRDQRVVGLVIENGDGQTSIVHSRLVVGADGMNSTVARSVGAEIELHGRSASASVYGYWRGIDTPGYRWYYRSGIAAGSIPTRGGDTLVFVSVPEEQFGALRKNDGYRETLQRIDTELSAEVADARQSGRFWGFPGRVGYYRRSYGPGWALVGDASYFKDPLTAHGMSDALHDAELLARCFVEQGEPGLARYQHQRDTSSRRLFELSDRIASFEWQLDEVKALHFELSREMNREVEAIDRWDRTVDTVAA